MSMARVIARWVDDTLESPFAVDVAIEDRRIVGPSLVYMSEPAVDSFLSAVRCPVLLLEAAYGWPRDIARYARRARLLSASAASFTHRVNMPGGHHFHLDQETAGRVCAEIASWTREVLLPAYAG